MLKELLEALPPPSSVDPDGGRIHPGRFRGFSDDLAGISQGRESRLHFGQATRTVSWMYLGVFFLGVLAGCSAVVKGLGASDPASAMGAVALALLGLGAFATLIRVRPLATLERHAIFGAWLDAATTSYRARLAALDDPARAELGVKRATDDLIEELIRLLERHGAVGTAKDR